MMYEIRAVDLALRPYTVATMTITEAGGRWWCRVVMSPGVAPADDARIAALIEWFAEYRNEQKTTESFRWNADYGSVAEAINAGTVYAMMVAGVLRNIERRL